ncbi:complex I subunit 4 family protein [Francisella adeliensis]|uniref:NADH-quinone oxidoreductase subunit M n=1 Tax=Francisella adeliensis TaxID=2007306 RepID=A0A2Z4XVV1_9GAMM|nr:NADH-quinone oxidoreductase subunit M [Francisella adeliensis]AXA32974.1 NADH-quinone oxidoreductase subunit M [Francisella adeliensis]MBK2086142.1 NADH-quinone oxidoreductase subunit M [Francisella adeliensis]MBK2096694.1 NADH-quinone oxidoreductase subunit M [Francisella adeliensis]QIW11200.1 NADH-quinone oxidoreductase subunit M [Francisella adeliensis]QIW13076.1 NADH-quinone oxidoreductase subunit M [Francisella adeliensis]
MNLGSYLLSLIIWMPIVGGFVVLATRTKEQHGDAARWVALVFSVLTVALCIPLVTSFDSSSSAMQFKESIEWFTVFGKHSVYYGLGVDGFSVLFIVLTSFATLVIVLAAWTSITVKVRQYMAIFLITCGLTNGVFCATDSILYYVFWEALLIPTCLGIGIWGGKNKAYAATKYFMYTFFGSVFLLAAILFLQTKVAATSPAALVNIDTYSIQNFIAWATHSSTLADTVKFTLSAQWLIFGAFFLAFAVKIPMWPFHSWLPDAHSEAPAGGSVILAALMLKLGAYGFLRFAIPMLPEVTASLEYVLITMSLIAIVYVGVVAVAQTDVKRLIAYSSISHMGLVTLGLFSIFILKNADPLLGTTHAQMALQGAVFQMIAHAFSSGGMFIGIGFLYLRMNTREIADFSGVAKAMPIFAAFFLLFCMANVGLPGTSGFVGEFMILLAVFQYSPLIALIAGLTLVIAPIYTLWMYKRVFFGEVTSSKVSSLTDLNKMELLVFMILAVPTLVFGLYPEPILQLSSAASAHIVGLSL